MHDVYNIHSDNKTKRNRGEKKKNQENSKVISMILYTLQNTTYM